MGPAERKTELQEIDTREKIVRAAMKVFASRGLFRAPLSLVAREAGVSKALIFWYFGSRDELVKEVIKRALPTDVVKTCLEKNLGGRELLKCIGEKYFEKYSDPVMRMLLIHTMAARGLIDYVDEAFKELCVEYLLELAERAWGSRDKESRIRARMLLGSLLCYALNPPRDIEPREYVEKIVEIVSGK